MKLCKLCKKVEGVRRYDYHNLPTIVCCERCYNSDTYPYRKDDYSDPFEPIDND